MLVTFLLKKEGKKRGEGEGKERKGRKGKGRKERKKKEGERTLSCYHTYHTTIDIVCALPPCAR
jgi:hypothetical protein